MREGERRLKAGEREREDISRCIFGAEYWDVGNEGEGGLEGGRSVAQGNGEGGIGEVEDQVEVVGGWRGSWREGS